MKSLLAISFVLCGFSAVNAQKLHLTVFGGVSNYQGDLQSKRITFHLAGPAVGAGILYEFNKKLYLRANITVGKIKGDDKKSKLYLDRNLGFASPVTDVHLGLEYDLLNAYERSVVPFVFGGISAFHFNPSTLDSAGKKVYLQPLGTEGQGFFQDRKKYDLTSFAIPFGFGAKLSLSQNIKVRFEMGFRKTFTDYLDDISTSYVDQTELLLNNGQTAVDLAFRGDEDKRGLSYPAANTTRGNPGSKDWYYFTGVGISLRLAPKFDRAGGGRDKTGCPVNVY